MLREATQGAMTALRSRSMAKRETRIAMTMIEDARQQPAQVFPRRRQRRSRKCWARAATGYLRREEALRAAFRDIQAHELAVVAGMRAALAHAMARIEPAPSNEVARRRGAVSTRCIGNRRARSGTASSRPGSTLRATRATTSSAASASRSAAPIRRSSTHCNPQKN